MGDSARVTGCVAGRRFDLVDVFAEEALSGNPLPVVIDAEGLDDEIMMRITRWMNHSETTFLLPPTRPEADYRVRIFTLERELPFAGHPTLGSCHAWLARGGRPRADDRIVQECGAGLVPIRRRGDGLAFAAPPLLRSGPVAPEKQREVLRALRLDSADVREMAWIDNGPGWIGVRLDSARAVLELDPVRFHPARLEIGVVGPCPESEPYACEVRAFFSDQHGNLLEDPVTGSLNASVAQWLLAAGQLQAPYRAHQGTRIGRSGIIDVSQDGEAIWIGGRVVPVAQGELSIDGAP